MKRTRSGFGSGSTWMAHGAHSGVSKRPRKNATATAVNRIPRPVVARTVPEVKWIDIASSLYPFTAAPGTNVNCTLLNQIQQGTSTFSRIANKIDLKSLHMNGILQVNQVTTVNNDDVLRWAIVYDREPATRSGLLPLYSEVFGEITSSGGVNTDVFSGVNLNNTDRFVILRNKLTQGPGQLVGGGAGQIQAEVGSKDSCFVINEHIDLRGLNVQYNGTSNPITVANITHGALYLFTQGLFGAGSTTPTAPIWNLFSNFRLKYSDV